MSAGLVWPVVGTGAELAGLLRQAAQNARNRLSGSPTELVDGYLNWVADQVRMLQGRIEPADLDRLVTSPRYWATLASPSPSPSTVSALLEELQFRARLLTEAADELSNAAMLWRVANGPFANLVVVDTNFWVANSEGLGDLDWHRVVADATGPGRVALDEELRIVVPMVVVDELDGLSHRRDQRPKVVPATKWLYRWLGGRPSTPVDLRDETRERGLVSLQLMFEPRAHVRLPNNDDEIIETAVRLRDFLGMPKERVFFLSYDAGAGFRAGHAGLMPRRPEYQPS